MYTRVIGTGAPVHEENSRTEGNALSTPHHHIVNFKSFQVVGRS